MRFKAETLPTDYGFTTFSPDTAVASPSGERAIGSLAVGDRVLAYNPTTGKSEAEPVQHIWRNHNHDLVDVRVTTTTAGTTGSTASSDTAGASAQSTTRLHRWVRQGAVAAGLATTLLTSASSTTAYYSYNQQGDVEALTDTAGATLATYGYIAYGADDTATPTLDSGPDASPSAGAFPFNSYRFGAGRLDPTTGNLDLGVGAYNPNINGFISQAAIAGAPSGANAPSRPLTWGDALQMVGDFFSWDWIQQGFHTDFQTNASLGDKAWAAGWALLAIAGDVAMVADGAGLLVKGAGWAVDAVKVARLAKGADEAITATSDAEKLVAAASDAEKLVTAADDGVGGVRGVCGVGAGLSFSADTLVATPSGERAIGSLKVGDQVTAYDPDTGTSSTQTVQHVWVNHDHDLLDVTLHEDGQDGHATEADSSDKTQQVATKAHGSQAPPSPSQDETIHTTAKHPWLTTDRGWVKAGDLHVGERVVALGGRTATITALAVRPGAATYYNLTVSTLHTYAVGASRAVVHNCNPEGTAANNLAKKLHNQLWQDTKGNLPSGVDWQYFRDNVVVSVGVVSEGGVPKTVIALNEGGAFPEFVAALRRLAGPDATYVGPDALKLGGMHAEQYVYYYAAQPGRQLLGIGVGSIDMCVACATDARTLWGPYVRGSYVYDPSSATPRIPPNSGVGYGTP